VARLDDGDIFILNRKSGDRTLIKRANVRSEIALNADEMVFVNRQEKSSDSVVYLNLAQSALGF
jgi:UDP-N-acetylmuramyl tripeptide synthase